MQSRFTIRADRAGSRHFFWLLYTIGNQSEKPNNIWTCSVGKKRLDISLAVQKCVCFMEPICLVFSKSEGFQGNCYWYFSRFKLIFVFRI